MFVSGSWVGLLPDIACIQHDATCGGREGWGGDVMAQDQENDNIPNGNGELVGGAFPASCCPDAGEPDGGAPCCGGGKECQGGGGKI